MASSLSTSNQDKPSDQPFQVAAPSLALPKAGGAIRGIGEKFAANPVTRTGTITVPIAVSPGRSAFGPQLTLDSDSGSRNGPFGLGWNLSLPSIKLRTNKGLSRYEDADESDIFIISGSEDLVPVLVQDGSGEWVLGTTSVPLPAEFPVLAHRNIIAFLKLGLRNPCVLTWRPVIWTSVIL